MEQPRKSWYDHKYHSPLSHRLVFSIIPRVPRFIHPLIATFTAGLFCFLLPKERAAVVRNLRTICGRSRPILLWKAYKVFYSFCDFIVSYCFVPKASPGELQKMQISGSDGEQRIRECLEAGNGVVMWTAHLGNWEFASRLLECHGRPIHIARAVETDNPSEMVLRNMMTNDLLQTVDLADRFAPLRLLHALRNNEIVAMQGDRIYQDPGAEVEFFGRTARFPLGPFVLAHVARAPVLPALAIRESWLKYRLIVGAPIILDPSADRETQLRAALLQAVRFLETNLKTCHEQWLNFFDFWQQGSTRGN